jgi:hypothetical protein
LDEDKDLFAIGSRVLNTAYDNPAKLYARHLLCQAL